MIPALGIDLSVAATGITLTDGTSRTIRPHAGPDRPAARLREILDRVAVRVISGKPRIAAIEGYSLGQHNPLATVRLAELGGAVRLLLHDHQIPYVEIPPASLKLFATGSGKASKQQMIDAAVALGARIGDDDNQADSFFLWLAVQQRYEPHAQLPMLTKTLLAIEWPELRRPAA